MEQCTPIDVAFPFSDEILCRKGLEYICVNIHAIDPSVPAGLNFKIAHAGHAHNPGGLFMLLAYQGGAECTTWNVLASSDQIQDWIDLHTSNELAELFNA